MPPLVAEHYQERVAGRCRRTHAHLGPDHPNTLVVRDNLAYWQALAGG